MLRNGEGLETGHYTVSNCRTARDTRNSLLPQLLICSHQSNASSDKAGTTFARCKVGFFCVHGRNCVSTVSATVVRRSAVGGSQWNGHAAGGAEPRSTRRVDAQGEEQSGAHVSGIGQAHEHCRRSESSGRGRAQWLGEEHEGCGRASAPGERRGRRGQEVAFRVGFGGNHRRGGIQVRSERGQSVSEVAEVPGIRERSRGWDGGAAMTLGKKLYLSFGGDGLGGSLLFVVNW